MSGSISSSPAVTSCWNPCCTVDMALMLLGRSADTLRVGRPRFKGLKLLKAVGIATVAALLAVSTATAGPNLRVGTVEDAAIWSSDPGAQLDLAKLAGYDTVRMTAQWTTGMTQLPSGQTHRMQLAAMAASARGIQPVVAIYNQGATWTPAHATTRAQFTQ